MIGMKEPSNKQRDEDLSSDNSNLSIGDIWYS